MPVNGNLLKERRRPALLDPIDFYEFSGLGDLSFESIRQLYWYSVDRENHAADLRDFLMKVTSYYSIMKIQRGGADFMRRVRPINREFDEEYAREKAAEVQAASSSNAASIIVTVDQASSPHYSPEPTHQSSQTSFPCTNTAAQATPSTSVGSCQTSKNSAHSATQTAEKPVCLEDWTQTSRPTSPEVDDVIETDKAPPPPKVALWYDQYDEEEDGPGTPMDPSPPTVVPADLPYPPTPMDTLIAAPSEQPVPSDLPYPPTPMESIPAELVTAAPVERPAPESTASELSIDETVNQSVPQAPAPAELFLAATSDADLDRLLKSGSVKVTTTVSSDLPAMPAIPHSIDENAGGETVDAAPFVSGDAEEIATRQEYTIFETTDDLPKADGGVDAVIAAGLAAAANYPDAVDSSDRADKIAKKSDKESAVPTVTVTSSSDEDDDEIKCLGEQRGTAERGKEDEVVCIDDDKEKGPKQTRKRARTPASREGSSERTEGKRARADSTPVPADAQLEKDKTKSQEKEKEKKKQRDLDVEVQRRKTLAEQLQRVVEQSHLASAPPPVPCGPIGGLPLYAPMPPHQQNGLVFFRPPPTGFQPKTPFFHGGPPPFQPFPSFGQGPPPNWIPPNDIGPPPNSFGLPTNNFGPPPPGFHPFNGPQPMMNGMNGPPPFAAGPRPNLWCAFCFARNHPSENCRAYDTKQLRDDLLKQLGLCPHCLLVHPDRCRHTDVYCPTCNTTHKHHPALCRRLILAVKYTG